MPMGGALQPAEVETIRRWIEQGAAWDGMIGEAAKFWAFEKPVRPAVPGVEGSGFGVQEKSGCTA